MAVTPNSFISPQAVKSQATVVDTANTDYDDAPSANVKVIYQAGANGGFLTYVGVTPRVNCAATQIQLYRDGDGSGTALRLFKSGVTEAYVFGTGTKAPTLDMGFDDDLRKRRLAPNEKVYGGIGLSTAFVFDAEGEDF